jgi:hypothetical protein
MLKIGTELFNILKRVTFKMVSDFEKVLAYSINDG